MSEKYLANNYFDKVGSWSAENFSKSHISQLVEKCIPSTDIRGNRNLGVHVFDGSDELSTLGRSIEVEVFGDTFGNDLALLEKEYGLYDIYSTFIVSIDYINQTPTGCVRLIRNSDAGFKTLNDLCDNSSPWVSLHSNQPNNLLDNIEALPSNTVDIGSTAVKKEYRTADAIDGGSIAMYAACIRYCQANDIDNWIGILDSIAYDKIQKLQEPFSAFPNSSWQPYLGSPSSLPVWLKLNDFLEKVSLLDRKNNTNLYDVYTKSTHIKDTCVQPEEIGNI